MTQAMLLPMRNEPRVAAYVWLPGREEAERAWVCIRSEGPSKTWIGCWSSKGSASLVQVETLLRQLEEVVDSDLRFTPQEEPWLDSALFFEGWETWGPGIPEPLGSTGFESAVVDAMRISSVHELKPGD